MTKGKEKILTIATFSARITEQMVFKFCKLRELLDLNQLEMSLLSQGDSSRRKIRKPLKNSNLKMMVIMPLMRMKRIQKHLRRQSQERDLSLREYLSQFSKFLTYRNQSKK
jgi:hypothetical protein